MAIFGTKKKIRKRDRLRQNFLRLKTRSTELKYKSQRNKVNNIKKHWKVSYFEKISESLSDLKTTNIKMYWRTFKQLLKNYSPTYSLPSICAHENDTVYKFEDQEKAQLLNDSFCSIATLDNDNKKISPT